jgi:hypothetical protein
VYQCRECVLLCGCSSTWSGMHRAIPYSASQTPRSRHTTVHACCTASTLTHRSSDPSTCKKGCKFVGGVGVGGWRGCSSPQREGQGVVAREFEPHVVLSAPWGTGAFSFICALVTPKHPRTPPLPLSSPAPPCRPLQTTPSEACAYTATTTRWRFEASSSAPRSGTCGLSRSSFGGSGTSGVGGRGGAATPRPPPPSAPRCSGSNDWCGAT